MPEWYKEMLLEISGMREYEAMMKAILAASEERLAGANRKMNNARAIVAMLEVFTKLIDGLEALRVDKDES